MALKFETRTVGKVAVVSCSGPIAFGEQATELHIHTKGLLADGRLVLLDLKMPKVNGLQVLRQMKIDPLTRSIPVVALTSSRHERDIAQAYDLGVNSYVEKPVDFQQFSDVALQLGLYWLVLNEPPRRSRGDAPD